MPAWKTSVGSRSNCARKRSTISASYPLSTPSSATSPSGRGSGDEAELVVYRIAQESLTNAARHAETTQVDLTLERNGRRLILRVRDYGAGIDGTRPGSGIRGMRERALLIGADLSIAKVSGGGTEVWLSLPMTERV